MSNVWECNIQFIDNGVRQILRYNTLFRASSDQEAKAEVLAQLKRRLRRIKSMRKRHVMLMAAPLISSRVADGDRMIRLRYSFASSKHALTAKDPDKVFVQGYGPVAAQERIST